MATAGGIPDANQVFAWLEKSGLLPSLLLASLCGALISLGAPPAGWLWGHWLGYVPLVLVSRRDSICWRQAALLGLVGGMGIGIGGFPWIAEMLVTFAGVPIWLGLTGLLVFSLWLAVPYAIWAVGLRLGPFAGWRGLLWPVVLFVSLQSLWPVLFPYTPVLGFAERPELIQLAEIGGVHLIEALVLLSALSLSNALSRSPRSVRLGYGALAAAIPLLVFVYGGWRMRAMDAAAQDARTLRVALVQPNTPIGALPGRLKMDRLAEPSGRAQRAGAQLVVWPEAGAYPYLVRRPLRHDRQLSAGRVLSAHRLPTVFGANTREAGARFGYNSVYHMAADGRVLGRYDKVNLVPLGEYIPIINPDWVTDRIPQIAHHHAGERLARFIVEPAWPGWGSDTTDAVSLAPLICYEDIIPGFVRDVASLEGGVELFVNVTIDAWYGDSAEPWEHLALARFRSVEHRIPLVRSVSTGVSAIVDYNGRLLAHLPSRPVSAETLRRYPPELLVKSIRLPRNTAAKPTIYARFGWLFPHLCQLSVLAALMLRYRPRILAAFDRRSPQPRPPCAP